MTKDNCIMCGEETPYDYETHVDMRDNYIEGAGQLCSKCFNLGSERDMILIPKKYVLNYSNDAELGMKIRRYFFENYGL